MNVTCHPDTTFASHDHADRGRFMLSGAGRNWALQDSRPHESSQTNLVLIDGEGEGYFAPPARWLGTSETAKASLASCDMTYPYSWQWHKEAATWSPTDTRLQFPHYAALKEKVDELAGQKWEYDPSPGVVAYYANYLKGNPLMWDEDSWVVRRPHNPVRYAYRTAGIVRGAHPYALVVDDLEKDGKAHVYDWIMQLPEDVVLAAQRRQGGVLDITLAEQKGPRRLLLRFFQAGSGEQPQSATVEHFSTAYKLMSLPTQAGTMFRLNVPWRGVDYRGRVLLYAYREGDELPVSQWDAAVGRATVEWAGQRDVLVFTGQADGRAELSVERNGSVIATSR